MVSVNATPMKPDDLTKLLHIEMPFGKHKGRLLAQLPGNYLAWFAREGFPPGEIGRLLQLMHEIDHNGLRTLLDPLRADGPPRGKQSQRQPWQPAGNYQG